MTREAPVTLPIHGELAAVAFHKLKAAAKLSIGVS